MQNKHDPAKQLKKAGTVGQESKVFILFEENGQVEPIDTLPLNQEAVNMRLYDWIEQARRDAEANGKGLLPAVFHKKNNHDILVTMYLDDWMAIFREYESGMELTEIKARGEKYGGKTDVHEENN